MGTSRLDVNVDLQMVEAMRSQWQMQGTGADQLVVAMKVGKLAGAKGLSRSVFDVEQPKGRTSWRR